MDPTILRNNPQHNTTIPMEDLTSILQMSNGQAYMAVEGVTNDNTAVTSPWQVYTAVGLIQMIMAILSILGSGSIIFYAVLQRLVRTSEVQPLFLLSLTDLLLAFSWLSGSILFLHSCAGRGVCYNLHNIEQTLYMASFFYTLNYVWVLYTGLKKKYYSRLNGVPGQQAAKTNVWRLLAVIASVALPVLLMIPIFVTVNMNQCYANTTQPYRCLLLYSEALYMPPSLLRKTSACVVIHRYSIAIFLISFLLTLIGIVVFMAKARSLYRRFVTSQGFLGDRQWATLRVLEHRMFLYPTVLFFCWGPAVFVATIMLFKPGALEGKVRVIFYILQAFTSASQGLLNCLVYGWTQQHFRSLSSGAVRDADTQTPLLRSQKRDYAALRSVGGCTPRT